MDKETHLLKKLKSYYGFNKGNTKWISDGADILKYIGIEVIFINFNKDADGNWVNKIKRALILSISDFDPMTDTYLVKYRIVNEDKDTSWREIRIIPEGFSFGNPEETGNMVRFVPYSLHCEIAETEAFYGRLFELFTKRDTMPFKSLEQISVSKEQDKTLNYRCNIGAVIKTVDNEILWFRISKLTLKHSYKDKYKLIISDSANKTYLIDISSKEKEYKMTLGNEEIGVIKIIDLED